MNLVNDTLIEQYRRKIYRIAWKIQYKAKVQRNHELLSEDNNFQTTSFTEHSDNTLFMSQLIETLPPNLGKLVIQKIYIEDKTEVQVAKELHITQQAVSKWKRKILNQLYQTLTSNNYYT
ncbi:sigma-70 family RNA polymerase sigma factor (plasmid) [Paenibacillus peoriae]|uniref:sigma-70 family RNA polymerase sigma factor n=1 Tax=Paenibacillus peoriae TaxID=59893 RepID=UPI0032AEC8DF